MFWTRHKHDHLGAFYDSLVLSTSPRGAASTVSLVLSGAIAGIVDQPMQNFQRSWEVPTSAGSKAKGVISGVGKGIVGVFTKPIGGAAELVSQTGYGEFGKVINGSDGSVSWLLKGPMCRA